MFCVFSIKSNLVKDSKKISLSSYKEKKECHYRWSKTVSYLPWDINCELPYTGKKKKKKFSNVPGEELIFEETSELVLTLNNEASGVLCLPAYEPEKKKTLHSSL